MSLTNLEKLNEISIDKEFSDDKINSRVEPQKNYRKENDKEIESNNRGYERARDSYQPADADDK